MKKGFSLLHLMLLILISLILIRFDRISEISNQLASWIGLLFTDFNSAWSQLNLSLFDDFMSIIILLHVIVITLLFKNNKLFNTKITLLGGSLILLTAAILFAPLISNQNPNFFTDVGTTKLLPPMSSKKVFSTTECTSHNFNPGRCKKCGLSINNENNMVFADSCYLSGTNFCFFQKGTKKTLPLASIITSENKPIVKNAHFILGTDQFGRDVFSRVLYGARVSILIGILATLISLTLGISLGFWAGFSNSRVSIVLTRINETFLLFPMIFLAIMILMFFGSNFLSIVLVLGLSGWMGLFKIVKEEVIKIKSKDYFLSSKALGIPKRDLLFIDILPVIAVPITVNTLFQFGNVIIAESALSFLGLSLSSDFPSWGTMIENGQEYIRHAWWLVTFPSLALVLTLLLSNNFAQFINKKLDPRI
ncbi:MAG: ABC transporter permease [Melioribacteraceae bacterium]|nr:ABC transporter permease [Melioribacteraceae bacterium]